MTRSDWPEPAKWLDHHAAPPGCDGSGRIRPLFGVETTFTEEQVANQLEAARATAFQAGWEAGRDAALTAHDIALHTCLDAVSAQLRDAMRSAQAVAEGTIDALARTVIEALAVALPSLAARLAAEEALHFTTSLLPALAAEPRVDLAVAPELADEIRHQLSGERNVAVTADASLSAGDVRLRWNDGDARCRLAEVRRKVLAELAALVPANAGDAAPRRSDFDLDVEQPPGLTER
jgi:flagellar biosynthesis/type III secretory pathway protein FliH